MLWGRKLTAVAEVGTNRSIFLCRQVLIQIASFSAL